MEDIKEEVYKCIKQRYDLKDIVDELDINANKIYKIIKYNVEDFYISDSVLNKYKSEFDLIKKKEKKEYNEDYYKKHKEEIRERKKAYRKRNKEKIRISEKERRKRKKLDIIKININFNIFNFEIYKKELDYTTNTGIIKYLYEVNMNHPEILSNQNLERILRTKT